MLKAKALSAAKAHGALADWPSRLAQSERMRMSPVLTAELQDLWTSGRPILFIGIVADIARSSSDSVELTLDYGSLDQGHMFMGSDLRLRLSCTRAMAAPLLDSASQPSRMALYSDSAVVAAVQSIETSSRRDPDGSVTGVLTGVGSCIEVVPISEAVHW